ncbi:MAG TPA: cytochrome c [Caulobacteraceae bacterium]|nr:cytochrome c [Caulobacteraceae bacterium]
MLILTASVIAFLATGPEISKPDAAEIRQGRALAQQQCGACHAVGPTGKSPRAPAPPFRQLGSRFDIEAMPEALAEGISVGHPEMPQVIWEARDIEAFMAYLRTLQPLRPRISR